MNKRFFSVLISYAVIFCFLGLTGCTKKTDEIVIGEFGSLTGNEATFGQSTNKGIRLAFDEINGSGGIKGKKLKLITYDNQGKPDESASVVKRLITQDKVLALIGEVASSRSLAAAPIAQQYKVPMISPSSTSPKVTAVGDYIFRICFIDPFQGKVMAKFMLENLKLKKVAILRDVKNEYSVGLADVFAKEVTQRGGEILGDVSYQAGDLDFKAQLTQLKSKNPDAIFVPGYYTEVGLITYQARQLGIKSVFLGGDGWDSAELEANSKKAANGSYYSNHYSTESTDPKVQEFIQRFKAKYNEVPDAMSALGYDAAKILISAIERTNELTPENIKIELSKTTDHPGVTGNITLDSERNAVKSAVIVQVEGDKRKFIANIAP
jgi:branched-chain amino acid transport system substrate-binding protein